MKTIIVTGGAGFIGCNFVRLLLAKTDYHVVVLDKLTYAGSLLNIDDCLKTNRVTFAEGDIVDAATVRALFDHHKPYGLINFAAESHVDRSIDGPGAFVQTNIIGTFTLLEEARRYCLSAIDHESVQQFRFLHVSTDEVYGSLGPTGAFSEETAYAPNSPYSASKAGADHLVRAYFHTYGLPTLITNCSNNYGPYQFPEKLIPLMILNGLEAKPLPIYGDGGNIRDWIYVEDHCTGVLTAFQKGRLGEKYNIGARSERTNMVIVDALCKNLEKMSPAATNPKLKEKMLAHYSDLKQFVKDRPGHDRRYAIDSSKIESELGWLPKFSFDSGIEATVKWYVEHRDWCNKIQEGKYERERLGLTQK